MASSPINIRDLDAATLSALPGPTQKAIADLEALGYKREHLAIGADQTVFFDPELCTADGWLRAMDP
jgi:hypothetical protein